MQHAETLAACGFTHAELTAGDFPARSPIDGVEVGRLRQTRTQDLPEVIARARSAFEIWRSVPPPRRGELVRLFGEELRAAKSDLGAGNVGGGQDHL